MYTAVRISWRKTNYQKVQTVIKDTPPGAVRALLVLSASSSVHPDGAVTLRLSQGTVAAVFIMQIELPRTPRRASFSSLYHQKNAIVLPLTKLTAHGHLAALFHTSKLTAVVPGPVTEISSSGRNVAGRKITGPWSIFTIEIIQCEEGIDTDFCSVD